MRPRQRSLWISTHFGGPGWKRDHSQVDGSSRMAKRGRPIGARSRSWSANRRRAHFANVLMEVWLADIRVRGVRLLLRPLAENSEMLTLITECWRKRGNERRYTVPPDIKRKLCKLAVAHETALQRNMIQQIRSTAAEQQLRAAGLSDAQVAVRLSRLAREPDLYRQALKVYCKPSIGAHLREPFDGKP